MGRISTSGNTEGVFECEINGVYNIVYYSTEKLLLMYGNNGKEKKSLEGRVFAYVAHYLTTGDLVYPCHEGEHLMSSLLKEVSQKNLLNTSSSPASPPQREEKQYGGTLFRKQKISNPDLKLRVRTRSENRMGLSNLFAKMLRVSPSEGTHIYRPPVQNKGVTLVVMRSSCHGNTILKVFGPGDVLNSVLPGGHLVCSNTTHHHLNAQLTPETHSAHTLVMSLEELGFVNTVRSTYSDCVSGALVTQWLMYRRGYGRKLSSTGTARRAASMGRLSKGTLKKTDTWKSVTNRDSNSSPLPSDKTKSGLHLPSSTSVMRTLLFGTEPRRRRRRRGSLSSSSSGSSTSGSASSRSSGVTLSSIDLTGNLLNIKPSYSNDCISCSEVDNLREIPSDYLHQEGTLPKSPKSLTLGHRSFSFATIGRREKSCNSSNQTSSSNSILNICSRTKSSHKFTIKRVLSVLF